MKLVFHVAQGGRCGGLVPTIAATLERIFGGWNICCAVVTMCSNYKKTKNKEPEA